MTSELILLDSHLTGTVDAALERARQRSGGWLLCRRGCTECCIGTFPITALDGWRLRGGLDRLRASDPGRAAAVTARAREAVALMRGAFPGDADTGVLSTDEAADEAFAERFHAVPCPALDPAHGTCDLYEARPIGCRTYGPALCIDGDDLPPCHLCFAGARRREVEAARVRVRIAGPQQAALDALGEAHATSGDTTVAFALTKEDRIPRLEF